MPYPFPKRPEQQIIAAALLESVCRLAEVRCQKAQADWNVECEQMLIQLGSNKIIEQMKTVISQQARENSNPPREICRLADHLLFCFPGRPDTPLTIIQQRTRNLAQALILQAALQKTQSRLHQELRILTPSVD